MRHSEGAPATEESLPAYERFLAALGMTGGAALGMTGGAALGMTGGAALGMTGGAALGMTGGEGRRSA
ncbi:MAG: hypothetical protein OHK0050_44950 [Roseiflexaceae bacterium]